MPFSRACQLRAVYQRANDACGSAYQAMVRARASRILLHLDAPTVLGLEPQPSMVPRFAGYVDQPQLWSACPRSLAYLGLQTMVMGLGLV